jgi:hypothetical protein
MVRLFTPELINSEERPREWFPADMVAPNDSTEDDMLYVTYDDYKAVETQRNRCDSMVNDLLANLRKYGGHTANCAYHLSHYKGPVNQCDCGWTELTEKVHASAVPT